MKRLGVIIIIGSFLLSCTKQEQITPLKNNNTASFEPSLRKTDLRELVYIGTGPGEVDVTCIKGNGNCLPDFDVKDLPAAYGGMNTAINNNTQTEFFNSISYADVFGIDENHQIQDALEKGHLEIKIIKSGNTDFNLFIKPQHKKFQISKLVGKAVLVIPVVN